MRFEQITGINFKNNFRATEILLYEKLLSNAQAFIEREGDKAFLDKLKQRGCAIFASDENIISAFGVFYFIGVRKVDCGYFIEAMRTIENENNNKQWTDCLFDGLVETSYEPTSESVGYFIKAFTHTLKSQKSRVSLK